MPFITWKNRILILLIAFLQSGFLPAQNPVDELDSALIDQLLFIGRFKNAEFFNVTGSEYLVEEGWINGNIILNNNLFNDIEFNYDLVNDFVIAPNKRKSNIILNPELLSSFSFITDGKEHKFVRVESENSFLNGFAELIYQGSFRLYKKRRKSVVYNDVTEKNGFRIQEQLFLERGASITRVNNLGGIVRLAENRRAEIKKFIRENHIRFRIEEPERLIPLLSFIDTLQADES